MPQIKSIQTRNRELAASINAEARRDPASRYAGKYVGIANGQVVLVDADPEKVLSHLEQTEPDSDKCLCFEADLEYDQVQEIWGWS